MPVTNNKPYIIRKGVQIPVFERGGKFYYQIDGITYNIKDLNTVFNLNKKYHSYAEDMADKCGERYNNLVNKIKELKETESILASSIKNAKNKFYDFLSKIGVKTLHEIRNKSQYAQASQYLSDITSLKFAKIRVSSDIFSTANAATSEALSKGKFANQALIEQKVIDSLA